MEFLVVTFQEGRESGRTHSTHMCIFDGRKCGMDQSRYENNIGRVTVWGSYPVMPAPQGSLPLPLPSVKEALSWCDWWPTCLLHLSDFT